MGSEHSSQIPNSPEIPVTSARGRCPLAEAGGGPTDPPAPREGSSGGGPLPAGSAGPPGPGGASYLQWWALAGTRATSWLRILLKLPSGNPGVRWDPSRAGSLCFLLTTGTTLKRIVLQPPDTSRRRWGPSSLRLSTLRAPVRTRCAFARALHCSPPPAACSPPHLSPAAPSAPVGPTCRLLPTPGPAYTPSLARRRAGQACTAHVAGFCPPKVVRGSSDPQHL